jgi:LacI family transcriptional regulator, repressor for deo operon, udp, cdd, tsx, nupC, and nupG
LIITQSNYKISQEIEALDMLKRKQVDGCIIVSRQCPVDLVRDYSEYGRIVLCESLNDFSLSSVFVDQYKAFQAALSFLKKKSRTRVGYTLLRPEGKSSLARKKAYEEQFGEAKSDWVFNNALTVEFDNHPIAGALGITTVELPLHLLGETAFGQVTASNLSHQEVPFRLIERNSV